MLIETISKALQSRAAARLKNGRFLKVHVLNDNSLLSNYWNIIH